MKRFLILTIISLYGINFSFAQSDCKMCGTWLGMYKVTSGYGIEDVKLFVRITKHGGKYRVRVKRVFLENGYTDYFRQCSITQTTNNSISFFNDFSNHEYDEDNHSYMSVRVYYSIVYDNESLMFSEISGYYETWNENNVYKGKIIMSPNSNMQNIVLYKENDDW